MSVEDFAEHMKGRATQQGWPEPLDILGSPELVGWPELTPDYLPEPLYRYVMSQAERINADPCAIALHVLVACSSSCSDAWRARPKRNGDPWTQQPRLWGCQIKPVGSRGTEMIRSAFWPIEKIEQKKRERYEQAIASFLSRQENKELEKGEKQPPAPLSWLTTDSTVEAATSKLAQGDEHDKLTIMTDELTTFFGSFGRYDKSNAARSLWLESYDGGSKVIDRVIRGQVYVKNWSTAISGNIQPRKLASIGSTLFDDGLFQRFMVVHAKPMGIAIKDDVMLDKDVGSDYRKLHEQLRQLAPATKFEGGLAPAYFNDEAISVREALLALLNRLNVDTNLPTIVRETAPKWSGLVVRLALVYHLVQLADRVLCGEVITDRDRCEITGDTVLMAATWIRKVLLPNLFRLGHETLPEAGASDCHAHWIAGHVLSHRLEHVTARDIGRAYRALRGKVEEIQEAMEVLVAAGWAQREEKRRDSERWTINPMVHVVFAKAAADERARREAVKEAIKVRITDL
jgi:hypothetical protein